MRESLDVVRGKSAGAGVRTRVIEDLALSSPVPAVARCMNPDCTEWCEWTTGKPRNFHDRKCLERYHRVRQRLLREIQYLASALAKSPATSREGRELRAQLARRRWHLARYPHLD